MSRPAGLAHWKVAAYCACLPVPRYGLDVRELKVSCAKFGFAVAKYNSH